MVDKVKICKKIMIHDQHFAFEEKKYRFYKKIDIFLSKSFLNSIYL